MDYKISDVKNKEPKAITAFVKKHQMEVYRTCIGYVQSEADAMDIAQEVFIKALRSIDGFKEQSSVKTWLTRIAINLSLNYLRDNKKYAQNSDLSIASYKTDDMLPEADHVLEQEELKARLKSAIQALPERQREVFVLFHYNDQSYAEIANITGSSVAAVESLLQRARKNLKSSLLNYYTENFN